MLEEYQAVCEIKARADLEAKGHQLHDTMRTFFLSVAKMLLLLIQFGNEVDVQPDVLAVRLTDTSALFEKFRQEVCSVCASPRAQGPRQFYLPFASSHGLERSDPRGLEPRAIEEP